MKSEIEQIGDAFTEAIRWKAVEDLGYSREKIEQNQKIVDKAIHLIISDTKGLALEYLNQLFWYYTGDKRKSESDQNWLIEYKNDIKEFRKMLFKIVEERTVGKDINELSTNTLKQGVDKK